MTTIIERPIRELVLNECALYDSPEELVIRFEVYFRLGAPVPMFWAEGMLMFTQHEDDSCKNSAYAKEFIENRRIFIDVFYAPMPEYKQVVKMGGVEAFITLSKEQTAIELARYLKTRKKSTDGESA